MTSSGTYAFNPGIADLLLEAFSRCGVHATSITRHMMFEARRSVNLSLVRFSNRSGVNLWKVTGPITINLVAGTATYLTNAAAVSMLDVYYTQVDGGGTGVDLDRLLLPITRDQYAMIPNKAQAGIPSVYWYQKLILPQLTLWSPPITGAPTYVVKYYYLSQVQDAIPVSGQTADLPYLALDAFAAEVARRLARKFSPQLYDTLKQEAEDSWTEFASKNQDDGVFQLSPRLDSYYRT